MLIISIIIILFVIVILILINSKSNKMLNYYVKQFIRVVFMCFVLVVCVEAIHKTTYNFNELSFIVIGLLLITYLAFSIYYMIECYRDYKQNNVVYICLFNELLSFNYFRKEIFMFLNKLLITTNEINIYLSNNM